MGIRKTHIKLEGHSNKHFQMSWRRRKTFKMQVIEEINIYDFEMSILSKNYKNKVNEE